MALSLTRSISRFLRNEVLRDDYQIIDEHACGNASQPCHYKLARLHTLCKNNSYRSVQDCERIYRQLSAQFRLTQETPSLTTVMLIDAYLPHCITVVDSHATEDDAVPEAAKQYWRTSYLNTATRRYRLCLPPEVHALLIENTGALLAA